MRTGKQWATILMACGCDTVVANNWAPVFVATVKPTTFSAGDADIADFLGNVLHESGMLKRFEENLMYSSPQRLMAVWPTRFKTVQAAQPYVNNPKALANLVYGGRGGNYLPDDGWTFRGRGPIQITFRGNYERIGKLVGQDLTSVPDLAAQPHFGLEICIAWWEDKIPDSMLGETTAIRQRVNGGTLGLDDVKLITGRAKAALAANPGFNPNDL